MSASPSADVDISDHEAMAELSEQHSAVSTILQARLTNLQVSAPPMQFSLHKIVRAGKQLGNLIMSSLSSARW